jgi:hypothetical protein
MNLSTLNWLAIIASALSTFVLGGLWYSVLFAKTWMKENNFSEDTMKNRNMKKIFGLSFLWSFIMSFNLAMFLNDPKTTSVWGAIAGFLAGFGWVAMAIFVLGQFENKSSKYMLINAGYFVVSFTLMGLILGAWR